MDPQTLKNIFAPAEIKTSYVIVIERISSTKYKVEDMSGRIKYVEAASYYPPGAMVVVQGKQIIGRGNSAGKHRTYEV
ncbi:MAG: hypothetical protein ACI8PB_002912 [Desulforhopalus sp.]|jgi:hypothetical protein